MNSSLRENALAVRTLTPAMYARAQRLRYLHWIDNGQTDVRVIVFRERFGDDELQQLVRGLHDRGFSPLLSAGVLGRVPVARSLARPTPRELAEVGLAVVAPRGASDR